MIRAAMLARSCRIGQWLHGMFRHEEASGQTSAEWKGMEFFLGRDVAKDDPRLNTVYEHFRANLDAICEAARGAGVPVLLSTIATNLKDCAPLASLHRADLDPARRDQYERLYQAGAAAAAQGKYDRAVEELGRAAEIDDRCADVHFCLGRALLKAGQPAAARRHLVLARDLDALRFRADSRIDQLIREAGARRAQRGVTLVDFERLLEEDLPTSQAIPGEEWFYEHVHFRPEGNYALAAAMLRPVEALLPGWVRAKAARADAPLSLAACCRRIALTAWDRLQMEIDMAAMTDRPPFTRQLDHRRDQAARQAAIRRLRSRWLAPAAMDDALRQYEAALEANPDNFDLRRCYARLLLENRDYQAAARQWRYLLSLFPKMPLWHMNLGLVLAAQGDASPARAQFDEAARINPALRPSVLCEAGNLLLRQGKTAEAEQQFRRALEADPNFAKAQNALGAALFGQQRTAEAEQMFRRVLETEPDMFSARFNLAVLIENKGDLAEALRQYQLAMDTDPYRFETYYCTARVYRKLNQPRKAIEQYRRAVQVMPDNAEAHFRLANALVLDVQWGEADNEYRAALRIDPAYLDAGHNLGALLERIGRRADAIEQYRRVLKAHPDSAATRQSLDRLLGTP